VSDGLIIVLTLLVMLVGLVGVVVPVVPGVVLIGLAGIASTFLLGVEGAGWALVVVLAFLTGAGAIASWVLPTRRGLKSDAARSSLVLALVGAVVGFFVIPVLGIVVGALLGLYLGEHQRTRDRQRAWATTVAVAKSYGVGVLVELAAGLALIAIWLTATLLRL
jgi:uncharacterized protein YqgC (DUF456 family)